MRTKGSTATVKVTLKTLLDNHPLGENAVIEVRRKWLEGIQTLANVEFEIIDNTSRKVKSLVPAPTQIVDEIDGKGTKVPKAENILCEEAL